MPQEKPLAVDFSKKDAMTQVLVRPAILSSHKAGWDGIHVEYHRQPDHETPEHTLMQHTIGLLTQRRPVVLERVLNGRFQSLRCGPGDFFLAPANTAYRSSCNEETEFIALSLEPALFTRVTQESVDARIEIVSHFSISDPLIQQIALLLKVELETEGLGSCLYVESLATLLSFHLLRHYCAFEQKIPTYSGGLSQQKLRWAIEYINENLEKDLKLSEIAAVVGMSQYHFVRMFKQSTGLPPHRYLVERRLEKAKRFLAETNLPIAEIAYCVGFANQSSFTKVFHKHTATTPKVYRDAL